MYWLEMATLSQHDAKALDSLHMISVISILEVLFDHGRIRFEDLTADCTLNIVSIEY